MVRSTSYCHESSRVPTGARKLTPTSAWHRGSSAQHENTGHDHTHA
jgi:hypothetical protein